MTTRTNVKTSPSTWILQRSRRPRGWYSQAIYGKAPGPRRSITLGYLEESEAAAILAGLRIGGAALVRVRLGVDGPLLDFDHPDARMGTPILTDAQIIAWATDPTGRIVEEVITEAAEADFRAMMEAGAYERMTLADFATRVYRPVRRTEVAASTVVNEAYFWEQIEAGLGTLPLVKVDGVRIAAWLGNRTTWGGATKRLAQNTLRCCLKYAVEIGALPAMPTMRPIKGSTARTLAEPVALQPAEVAALLDAAPSPAHRALYALAIGNGLRPGECGIDWSDVNWKTGMIHVRGTKTKKSNRVVPLTPATYGELLNFWIEENSPTEGRAFMWRGAPIGKWKKGFKSAAKKAGITDGRRIFPNLCRHTFGTSCAMGNTPSAVAKALMGHTPESKVYESTYVHPHIDQVLAAVASMPTFVQAANKTPKGEEATAAK